MDWERAIERNAVPLMRIVAALFALLASSSLPGPRLMVPRHVWRSIFLVLRPAEAAVRRLIIIAARALVHAPSMFRQHSASAPPAPGRSAPDTFSIAPVFRLFDPLKPLHSIFVEDGDEALHDGEGLSIIEGDPDTPVDAVPLHNRMRALRLALADLPAQAMRLARHNARRDATPHGKPVRMSLMRPGLPPGWRERGKHEVDTVLKECHALVRYLENTPYRADTS